MLKTMALLGRGAAGRRPATARPWRARGEVQRRARPVVRGRGDRGHHRPLPLPAPGPGALPALLYGGLPRLAGGPPRPGADHAPADADRQHLEGTAEMVGRRCAATPAEHHLTAEHHRRVLDRTVTPPLEITEPSGPAPAFNPIIGESTLPNLAETVDLFALPPAPAPQVVPAEYLGGRIVVREHQRGRNILSGANESRVVYFETFERNPAPATLNVSATSVAFGGTLKVSWSRAVGATPEDWIGLFLRPKPTGTTRPTSTPAVRPREPRLRPQPAPRDVRLPLLPQTTTTHRRLRPGDRHPHPRRRCSSTAPRESREPGDRPVGRGA